MYILCRTFDCKYDTYQWNYINEIGSLESQHPAVPVWRQYTISQTSVSFVTS